MALPKEYIEANEQDAMMRLSRSIISYKGSPVIVAGIRRNNRHHSLTLCSTVLGITKNIPLDHPDLSVANLGSHLGYFKTEAGMVHCSRVPTRQFCQGLNLSNTHLYLVKQEEENKKKYKSLNANARAMCHDGQHDIGNNLPVKVAEITRQYNIPFVLVWLLSRSGFLNMWNNNYTQFLEPRRPGYYALSRQYYVDREDVVYTNGVDNVVGKMVGKRIKYEDKKQYLAQSIERLTGIVPI